MKFLNHTRVLGLLVAAGIFAALASGSALFAARSDESHQDKLIEDLEKSLAETWDIDARSSLEEKLKMANETRKDELDAKDGPVDLEKRKELEDKLKKESEESDKKPKV